MKAGMITGKTGSKYQRSIEISMRNFGEGPYEVGVERLTYQVLFPAVVVYTLAMADLTKVSFMDGWNSIKYQDLRKAHLEKDVSKTACAECAL